MLSGVRQLGIEALPWDRDTRELQARIAFVRAHCSAADATRGVAGLCDDGARCARSMTWLAPWLAGMTRREHLARIAAGAMRCGRGCSASSSAQLEALARRRICTVPSGSHIRIDYLDESAPLVAVRLQEVFGLDSDAAPRRRSGAGHLQAAVAGAAAGADDARSGGLLAQRLRRGAQGHARPLSEALTGRRIRCRRRRAAVRGAGAERTPSAERDRVYCDLQPAGGSMAVISARAALQALREGNRRFVSELGAGCG